MSKGKAMIRAIRERAQFPVNGKECVIEPCDGGFILISGEFELIDWNPRWLSESALWSGAKFCTWSFDLNLARDFI